METQIKNDRIAASIQLAIDQKANFELYAYRCISPETYVERTAEITRTYFEVMEACDEKEKSLQVVD